MSNELSMDSMEIAEPHPFPEPQLAEGADEESEQPAEESEEIDERELSEED